MACLIEYSYVLLIYLVKIQKKKYKKKNCFFIFCLKPECKRYKMPVTTRLCEASLRTALTAEILKIFLFQSVPF